MYGGSEFSAMAKDGCNKDQSKGFYDRESNGLCEGVSDGLGFSAVDRLTEQRMIVMTGQRRFVIEILMVGVKGVLYGLEFN